MAVFKPKLPQDKMIDWMLANRFCGIWASMGIGKTSATLNTLSILKVINDGPTLIVAPKYVATFTWPDEVAKWGGFGNLTISVVTGTAAQREAALAKKADLYSINFENLQWLETALKKHPIPFAKCVIDESTKIKKYRRSRGSKRARALFHIVKNVKYLIELTGTPGANGLLDLWGQIYFLDLGKRLGTSYGSFESRWFEVVDFDSIRPKVIPRKHAMKEITEVLKDICLSVNAEDYFKLDEVVKVKVPVHLPPSARKMYDEFWEQFILDFDSPDGGKDTVRAFDTAGKTLKCLQIASGALYKDEERKEYIELHDAKLEALESVVEEAAGEPLLIVYHFRHDIERILKRFPGFKLFDGKESTLRAWNNGEIDGMLVHPASVGHGINLQDGGRRIVFFSHWWNPEEKRQVIERIGPMRQLQSGHQRTVFQYEIFAVGTVDERVIKAHDLKLTIDEALRAGTQGA